MAASSACPAEKHSVTLTRMPSLLSARGGHDAVARQRALHHDVLVDLGQLAALPRSSRSASVETTSAQMSPSTMSQIMRPAPRSGGLPWRSARGWWSRRRQSPKLAPFFSSSRFAVSRKNFTVPSLSPAFQCISAGRNHAYNIETVPGKTFYIETFGCQMNAHDSEKVIGTLVAQGYSQVETPEAAELVLYNTCSIRDKAEQKVFNRLQTVQARGRQGQDLRRARLRGAAGRREDLRPRAARQPGGRLGQLHPAAAKCWCSSKPATGASPASAWIPTRPSTRPSRAATIRTAPTSRSSKAATNPAPIAWCRSRAVRSAAAPARA